jgi:uncharacterized protein (TIGR00369 family)
MSKNKSLQLLEQILEMEGDYESPSPYMRWLNGHLVAANEGEVTVEFIVRKEMCNPADILHGGVISGMIDEVVGIAVFSIGREHFFSSINLQVDFLRPAKLGDKVSVTAKVIRNGNRIIHVTATMNKNDKLLARGDTNLIITEQELPQFQ